MKRTRIFLLVFFSALVIAPRASIAQSPSPVSTTAPVLLGAEFHPGETVRYTFSQKMNLTSRVDSRFATAKPSFTPRQYQVEGEIVATFAPTQPGEPLRGTVQFQGLTVKNWVSSAKLADLEARLRQLEAALQTLTTAADGNFELSKMPADPINDPHVIDVVDLDSLARDVLTSRISSEPLAPGQRRESADFPIHGMVHSGIKVTTLTEYITDVPIARHPSAEVRLSVNVPTQFQTVPSEEKTSKLFAQVHGAEVLTYLLDLDAHQIIFLHNTGRSEADFSIESTDTDASVRIPVKVMTLSMEDEQTARRVAASAPPEREADLAAFEKSLAAPPRAASEAAGATATVSPGGEVSLGDLAQRLRAERAAQGPPRAEITLPGSAAPVESVPTGFKQETFPDGDMTVLVPVQASELQRTSNFVQLRASLDTPRTVVGISMGEVNVGQASSPDDVLDVTVRELQAKAGFRVVRSERKNIGGKPGVVIELQLEVQGHPVQELQADVISGGKAFVTTCGAVPADFPKVESLCRTVVESIRVR